MFDFLKKKDKVEQPIQEQTAETTIQPAAPATVVADANVPTADASGTINITSEPIVDVAPTVNPVVTPQEPIAEATASTVEEAPAVEAKPMPETTVQPAVEVAPAPAVEPAPAPVEPINAETVPPVSDDVVENTDTPITQPTAQVESAVSQSNIQTEGSVSTPEAAPAPVADPVVSSNEVATLDSSSEEGQSQATPNSAPAKDPINKFCPNCGNMETGDAVICSSCGSRL